MFLGFIDRRRQEHLKALEDQRDTVEIHRSQGALQQLSEVIRLTEAAQAQRDSATRPGNEWR